MGKFLQQDWTLCTTENPALCWESNFFLWLSSHSVQQISYVGSSKTTVTSEYPHPAYEQKRREFPIHTERYEKLNRRVWIASPKIFAEFVQRQWNDGKEFHWLHELFLSKLLFYVCCSLLLKFTNNMISYSWYSICDCIISLNIYNKNITLMCHISIMNKLETFWLINCYVFCLGVGGDICEAMLCWTCGTGWWWKIIQNFFWWNHLKGSTWKFKEGVGNNSKMYFKLTLCVPCIILQCVNVTLCVPCIILQSVNVTLCVPCIILQCVNDQRDAQFL